MITLNTIVKRFEDFANNHFFIRSFSFGGPEDVDLQKFDQYPLLHLIYTGATYEDTTKTLDFEVYIFDLPSAYENKNDRQKEVVSDAEQCAEYILADIANGHNIFIDSEDYEVANATVTPLQEANSNVLAGVLLELSITLPYDRSACDAPIDGVQPEGGGFVYQRRGLLRVLTQDGTVDVLSVNTIKVTNGTLTDEGSGVVSIDTGGGGGATNLDDLADVVITDPLDHDALVYDEGTGDWINGAPKALDMPVYNGSGAIISKGALCKAIGTHGDRVSVGLFDLDVDDPKYLVGLASAQIAIAGTGYVRTYGELRGISTDTYPVGTVLYASGTAGAFTSTAGSPELAIAIVTRSQQNTGRLFIRTWTPNSGKAFRYITVGATTIEAEKQEDTLTLTAGTGISLTPDAGTDAVTIASTVTAPNTFGTIAVAGQTPVTADSTTDTLTFVAGSNITLTTDAGTDSITIAASGGGGGGSDSFKTIAVAGQSPIVADSGSDTLTFAIAGGMTITTDATTDTITFDSRTLDDDDVTLNGPRVVDLNGDGIEFQQSAVPILGVDIGGVYGTGIFAYNGLQYPSADGVNGQSITTDGSGLLTMAHPFSQVTTKSATSITLALGDAGKYIRCTGATAITVTIPQNVFAVGHEILLEQNNTAQVTIAAGAGVTLRNSADFLLKTSERYSIVGLKCVATNEFILTGERELA